MFPITKTMFKFLIAFTLISLASLILSPVKAQTSLQEHIDRFCKRDCVDAQKLTDVSYRAAKRFDFDYKAIMAIIHVESKYHTKAKNGSSVGLTQVLLRYHRPKFLGKNVFDVEDNIFAGAQVFRDCLSKHQGSYPKAFSCYNGYSHGDPKYRTKTHTAYLEMKKLDVPTPAIDPLGDFINHKVK